MKPNLEELILSDMRVPVKVAPGHQLAHLSNC